MQSITIQFNKELFTGKVMTEHRNSSIIFDEFLDSINPLGIDEKDEEYIFHWECLLDAGTLKTAVPKSVVELSGIDLTCYDSVVQYIKNEIVKKQAVLMEHTKNQDMNIF